MKKMLFFILCAFVIVIPKFLYTQTMSDYCSLPPYATRTIPPNIIILMHNSSDSGMPAYGNDYTPNERKENYYGLFDSRGCYQPDGSNTFLRTSSVDYLVLGQETTGCGPGQFNGNILNWALMSRLTLMKKVLTGGKFSPSPLDPQRIIAEGAGWTRTEEGCTWEILSSGDTLSLAVSESAGAGRCSYPKGGPWKAVITRTTEQTTGIFQDFTDKNPSDNTFDKYSPRFGLTYFEAWGSLAFGEEISPDNYARFLTNVQDLQQNTFSPLATGTKAISEYFRSPSPLKDPYTDCATWESSYCTESTPVSCRKSFILILTSGNDISGDSVTSTATCNQTDPVIRNACYAFQSDLRPDIEGPPKQNILTYVVHTWGGMANQQVLKETAHQGGGKYYVAGEGDLKTQLTQAFQDMYQQATSGTALSFLPASSRGIGSVVQASYLPVRQEGAREVWWTGYVQSFWTDFDNNLREDTLQDYRLALDQDRVMKIYFNPNSSVTERATFTTDADGYNGTYLSCSNPDIKPVTELKPVWDAGKKLALRSPSERRIFTVKKVIRGTSAVQFRETPYPEFKSDMNLDLKRALNPDATYSANAIIQYIRGECLETGVSGDVRCGNTPDLDFRDRRVTVDGSLHVWKLGDIINSKPAILAGSPLHTYHVDYADKSYYDYISSSSYRNRSSLAIVGANDGMLHAFRVGYLKEEGLTGTLKALFKSFFSSDDNDHEQLGEEVWAYIPWNAFPYLKYLADPGYCHLYYSDLSIRLVDASINGSPTATKDRYSWRTLAIGGMRFGGACGTGGTPSDPPSGSPLNTGFSSYFAIDVTDSENPVPLWEFSEADMGYSTSMPSIVRTGDRNNNGKWYVVFGSGSQVLPNTTVDIGRHSKGYVYILDLLTGDLVKKIALDHEAIAGDLLSVDTDRDYQTEKIYLGTAFKPGASWMGKIVSIQISNVLGTPGIQMSWSTSFGKVLFSGGYPFTASPEVAKDVYDQTWIFSGSGKYYSDLDETDPAQQVFFGIKDKDTTFTEGDLFDATHIQTYGEVNGTKKICAYDTSTNSFGLIDVVTSINATSANPIVDSEGWKVYLPSRERVISRPLVVGGIVDFLTYKPDADPCRYSGDSYLYSLSFTTGLAPSTIGILFPEATSGTSGTITVYKGIRLGTGAPPAGEAIITTVSPESVEQVRKKIKIASGTIAEVETQPEYSVFSQIMHWLKK